MGRYSGNTCRLVVMMMMVFVYMLVELIVGHVTNSIALVADSFHMLSDLVAMAVGLAALRIAKWPRSTKNTFGWQRAEVLGTLVNTVILITLCFTILIEAIQRYIEQESIKKPRLMLGVGIGGLVINIVGLAVLWGGHGHGHSHGGAPIIMADELPDLELEIQEDDTISDLPMVTMENGAAKNVQKVEVDSAAVPLTNVVVEDSKPMNSNSQTGDHNSAHHDHNHGHSHGSKSESKSKSGSMNMKAVFLHVMADALGSVVVIISALIIWLVPGDGKWKVFIDPSMSVFMVAIILFNAIPLLRKASLIVLQSVPKEICIKKLKERMETIEGIHKIHDLHVWQLQPNCIIGTVHVICANQTDYLKVSQKVKELFHDFNIHCTTIQPEFSDNIQTDQPSTDDSQCVLSCGTKSNKSCNQADVCCPAPLPAKSPVSKRLTIDEPTA